MLDARVVVLLVLDGLGWDAVQAYPSLLPTLREMTGGPVTTVVPSTTAAPNSSDAPWNAYPALISPTSELLGFSVTQVNLARGLASLPSSASTRHTVMP